nr:hypothetical protein [Tanacetum cinerariifolium]
MESLSPQVVSVAKLPILNPNEFDLWKMRIEQYFLMTDYSLWEVILNGDSPVPTRVVDGVLQPLKFNSHKDAKTLTEAIEKRFGGNTETKNVQKTLLKQQYENFTCSSSESLDQIHDRLQKLTSQLETLGVSLSQEDINLKTTESVSAAASISTISAKLPVSSLLNIDADDLDEMDLKWKMAMLTVRARRFLQRTGRNIGANGTTSMGFDMSKVECYNCHKKGHFARECRYPKDSRRNGVAEPQRRNVPVETSTSNALVSQWSDESWPPSSLYDKFQSSDGYHVVPLPYTRTFMPPKPDLVFNNAPNGIETDHSAFNVKLSPTKTAQDLSQTYRPSAPIIEDCVSDSEDEYETKAPQIVPIATPKPTSPKPTSNGKRRNRKACFVCKSVDHLIKDCDYHAKKMAQPTARNHAHRVNHKQYAPMTHQNPQKHMVHAVVLTQSKTVPITVVRPVSATMPKLKVPRPRHAKPIVTKSNSPTKRRINRSPSPKASIFPPIVTVVKAPIVNAAQGMQGKLEWKPKCPILDHVSDSRFHTYII